MSSPDPFHILGLTPGTPPDEVRRAYRKLAMRWHPDRNPRCTVSEARFKEIKAAYDAAMDATAVRPEPDAATASADDAPTAAADGAAAAPAEPPASPIEQTLAMTLEEAARGGRRTVRVGREIDCTACAGHGRVDQAHSTPCRQCQGVGRLPGKGLFSAEKCPGCAGRGYVRHVDCPHCDGRGRRGTESVFDVRVPAGLRDNETLRLARPGGSVLLHIEHLPHALFTLRGDDLHCTVPVDVLTWLAGGDIDVPTLDGLIRVVLPAAAPSAELRLAGKGFPQRHGRGAGDLVLQLNAVFPVKLAPAETAQLQQLATALAGDADRRAPALQAWNATLGRRDTRAC